MYDGIEYRGSAQANVETLARYAGVPVWNGLTDEWRRAQQRGQLAAGDRSDDGHGRADGGAARLTQTASVEDGVRGVDFLYTYVWVSIGEPKTAWHERIDLLRPNKVTMDLVRRAGNPQVRLMHCLPAFHDRHTTVGEALYQETG